MEVKYGAIKRLRRTWGTLCNDTDIDELLFNRGSPITFPQPNDFPLMGFVERSEALSLRTKLQSPDSFEDEWERSANEELLFWLMQSVESSQDLLTFYS